MVGESCISVRLQTRPATEVSTKCELLPKRPLISVRLPLSQTMPDQFKFLPEYALEDILTNFIFISRHMPDILFSAVGDEMIAMCVTFLTNSEYIKNPYLKAKLVSVLFHGSFQVYHRQKGIFGDSLTSSKFCNDYLLHALLKFYIGMLQTFPELYWKKANLLDRG